MGTLPRRYAGVPMLNDEIRFSALVLEHLGHSGASPPRMSSSKVCPQLAQSKS